MRSVSENVPPLPPAVLALRSLIDEKRAGYGDLAGAIGMNVSTFRARMNGQTVMTGSRAGDQEFIAKVLAALGVEPSEYHERVRTFVPAGALGAVAASFASLRDGRPAEPSEVDELARLLALNDGPEATAERLLVAIVYDCDQPEDRRESARRLLLAAYSRATGEDESSRSTLLSTLFDCSSAGPLRRSIYSALLADPVALASKNTVGG